MNAEPSTSPYADLMRRAVPMDGQLMEGQVPMIGLRLFKDIGGGLVMEAEVSEVFGGGQFQARMVRVIDLNKGGMC